MPQDHEQDIAMDDTVGEGVPNGDQDQDSQPNQVQQSNKEVLGTGQQEGQQQEDPVNHNTMTGNVPPEIIKKLECKCLPERLGFNFEMTQIIVHNHGYDTVKKLSHLKPSDVGIITKILHSPGRVHQDRIRDPEINMLHLAQNAFISACFILFHQVSCDLNPMINGINDQNVYNMDLQLVQDTKQNYNLYCKSRPKGNAADPEQSLTNIREYFESLCGTKKAPCSYLLGNDMVPLIHRNQGIGFWSNPDMKMIEKCPIIPIKEHHIYYNRLNADLLKAMSNLRSPNFVVVLCQTQDHCGKDPN